MKHVLQYVGAGVLTLGLGLAPAWAFSEKDARAELEQHAADARLASKDRSAALSALSALVSEGVPLEQAYDIVEAGIDNGMTAKEFGDMSKYVETRREQGTSVKAAANELAARIEQREAAQQNHARDRGTFDKDDMSSVRGGMMDAHGNNVGGHGGVDVGSGQGGMEAGGGHGGIDAGAGAGTGGR